MCGKNTVICILEEAYSACASIFKEYIKEAYLYGSYARGDYSKESDVDILVTVALDRTELSKYRNALASVSSDLSLKHNVTVSLTVKPYDEFMLYSSTLPFYMNVMKEGIRYAPPQLRICYVV